jgi:hypothetical protein
MPKVGLPKSANLLQNPPHFFLNIAERFAPKLINSRTNGLTQNQRLAQSGPIKSTFSLPIWSKNSIESNHSCGLNTVSQGEHPKRT